MNYKPIAEVQKELEIENRHVLYDWEKRGWLGSEPVVKDPDNNSARLYTEEQIRRIELIKNKIDTYRENGIQRLQKVHFQEIEQDLLETFGGEVKEMNQQLPDATSSEMMNFIQKQNMLIQTLVNKVEHLEKEIQTIKKHNVAIAGGVKELVLQKDAVAAHAAGQTIGDDGGDVGLENTQLELKKHQFAVAEERKSMMNKVLGLFGIEKRKRA